MPGLAGVVMLAEFAGLLASAGTFATVRSLTRSTLGRGRRINCFSETHACSSSNSSLAVLFFFLFVKGSFGNPGKFSETHFP